MQYEDENINEEKKSSDDSLGDVMSGEIRNHLKNELQDNKKANSQNAFENDSLQNNSLNNNGLSGIETEGGKNSAAAMGNTVEGMGQEAGHAAAGIEAGTAGAETAAETAGASAATTGSAATAGTSAAAAGSAATGVGIPIAALLTAITAGKAATDGIGSISKRGTMDDDYHLGKGLIGTAIFIIVGIIGIVLYFFMYCGSFIRFITPGPVERYRESQFVTSTTLKTDFLKDDYPTVKKVLTSYNGLEEYSKEQLNKNAIDVYVAVLDAAIVDIFYNYVDETLEEFSHPLFIKLMRNDNILRDDAKTRENFLSQPYPYCKKRQDGYVYSIRDFIGTTHPEVKDIGEYVQIPAYTPGAVDYLNNDVNYAEILAVFSMKEDFTFNADNNTLEQFARILCSEKTKQLLYEIKIERVDYKKEIENQTENNGIVETFKSWIDMYYLSFTVKPYGLRELFMIVEVDKYDIDPNFKYFTNLEMFNRKENYLRVFAEDGLERLGVGYDESRSANSLIYADGAVTGRSLEYYIYDADNLEEWEEEEPEWDREDIPSNPIEIEYTTGSKIIDMPDYINQGTCSAAGMKRGNSSTTIKSSGCIDCSYIMIAEYYTGESISVSSIASNKNMYVGDAFAGYEFLARYGMQGSGNINFDIDVIRSYIDKGMPLIFHIRGFWRYNGVTYHNTSNGHFLVIMGYDNNGLYVYDPGSQKNTTHGPIPYEAFYYVSDKYIRVPYKAGFTPKFKE